VDAALGSGKSVVVGLLGTGEAYAVPQPPPQPAAAAAAAPVAAPVAAPPQPGAAPQPPVPMQPPPQPPAPLGGGEAEETAPPAPAAILRALIHTVLFPATAPSADGKGCSDSVALARWLRQVPLEPPAVVLPAVLVPHSSHVSASA